LSFWKAPNRKVYAVTQANLDALDEPASDGSGDDESTPRAAKRLKKEINDGLHLVVSVRPPLVISRCCKSIIGCEQCVQQLVEGSNCPLCRCSEFEVIKLNGFDGLISAMANTITDTEEN